MRMIGRDLHTLWSAGAVGRLSDGQLLDWFLARQEDAAFAELVRRHGPMVMGVCRRGLRNHHDAEDAFQATFLVLARHGAAVQPREMLARWLHGVAWRITRKARATAGKRRAREKLVPDVPEPEAPAAALWDDLARVLDQELSRLPERYRAAVVLCDLEGQGRKQAAQQLGWPEGTLHSRLSRARALLAERLRRRGIALSGAALAALLAERGATAAVRSSLIASTARTASLFAAGSSALASTQVFTLTERTLRAMLISKLKVAAAVLAVGVALLGAGAAGLAGQGADKPEADRKDQARPPARISGGDGSRIEFLHAKDDFKSDHRGIEWTSRFEYVDAHDGWKKRFAGKLEDCQACHTAPSKKWQEHGEVSDRARKRIIRDLLVRQALRDFEATLKRLEQDMPDVQTELDALDEIEGAVRGLKEKIKAHSR